MPEVCFNWKIDLCKKFGKEYVEVISVGMNFKEAHDAATRISREKGYTYIHPFDDEKVIEGNATIVFIHIYFRLWRSSKTAPERSITFSSLWEEVGSQQVLLPTVRLSRPTPKSSGCNLNKLPP